MRPLVVLMVLAALAAATPMTALGAPGGGHEHGGGWRGGGPARGAAPYGRGGAPYGGAPYAPYRGGGRSEPAPDARRWGGRYPGPEGGPAYAEPPRSRNSNSLGQYYREQQDEAREGVRSRGYQTMAQVMRSIRRRTPGRPLDAGLEQDPDGRPVYRVRWGAANGRRIDYIIDAQTGAILRAEH